MRMSDRSSDVASSDLDAVAADLHAAAGHRDARIELRRQLHEPGGGARVEAAPVDDRHVPAQRRRVGSRRAASVHHFPSASRLDATLMYFWPARSEEHTSELQSLMRISYAVFCLKKKNKRHKKHLSTCK